MECPPPAIHILGSLIIGERKEKQISKSAQINGAVKQVEADTSMGSLRVLDPRSDWVVIEESCRMLR